MKKSNYHLKVLKEELLNYCSPLANTKRENKEALGIENLNILVFGSIGAGKSSLINTIYSALHGKVVKVSPSSSSVNHVTVNYFPYPLEKNKKPKNITLWDCWGFSQKNYGRDEFSKMINGLVKPGTKMGQEINTLEKKEELMIHTVIFVVTAKACEDKSIQEKLKKYFSIVTGDHGLNSLVVITKLDEKDKEIKDDVSLLEKSKKLQGCYDGLKAAGISSDNIMVIKNYTTPEEIINGNSSIDLQALKILERALINADMYFLRKVTMLKFGGKKLKRDEKKLEKNETKPIVVGSYLKL